MLDDNFWNKYERMMANPISRFFNRSEIRKMESEINNSNTYVSSYDRDSLFGIDSTSEYTNNMQKIVDQENLLKKQSSIVENSFLSPASKKESIMRDLNIIDIEKKNFRNHYEDILRYEAMETDINETLDIVIRDLQSEGVYFTNELYSMNEIGDSKIKIAYESNLKGIIEKNFGNNMLGVELLEYAEKENLLTKTPVELQNRLKIEFNKIDFSVDEVYYSYSNYCADFSEAENVPTFKIFGDSNEPYETIKYDPETDRWKGVNYDFDIPNPVEELKNIYKEDAKSVEDVVENMLFPEMDDPRNDYYNLKNEDKLFMDIEQDLQPTFTLGELVKIVNEQEDGFYQFQSSGLTIADDRFYNRLEIDHQANERVLVLSTLEQEKDIFVVGPNEVKWTDNWSGEDERIYKGDVLNKFEITFAEEMFDVNKNDLELSTKMTSPVVEIDNYSSENIAATQQFNQIER